MTFTVECADGVIVSFHQDRIRYVKLDRAVDPVYGMSRDGYKLLIVGLDGPQNLHVVLQEDHADRWFKTLTSSLSYGARISSQA